MPREGGHMWYKPWESDVVVLATQAPAAAKLTAQILKSVGADGDGGDGYGIASKILAMASAADRIRGNHCWSLTVAFAEPLNLSYEGVMMKEPFDGGIAWFANNSSKPGRPEPGKEGRSDGGMGVSMGGGWHFPDGGPGRVLGRPGVA